MTVHTIASVFGVTQQGALVERKAKRDSKPGDKIRQGRVDRAARVSSGGRLQLAFDARSDGCIYVLLARAEVGVICRKDEGMRPGYNWLCWLPEQRPTPQYAETLDKAKDAMRVTVESWCEAAGLAPRAKHPHRHAGQVVGWRAGD